MFGTKSSYRKIESNGFNSPLFYRLNYARITGRMIYLNCVQVKEFVNGGKENLSDPEKLPVGGGGI